MDVLNLIGRQTPLFSNDIRKLEVELSRTVKESSFLVIGGAGSIGHAVTREIFRRDPAVLHVLDISENNLVEVVRDLRSSFGYGMGDFQTFAIDCGSLEYDALLASRKHAYDYVLNLSALKHVRSESDPYTLMRMIQTNVFHTVSTVRSANTEGCKKYFCVSTDKAANPVNMMGASKRIMEKFMMRESRAIPISMARFANVAFSDGSLLHGFNQRLLKAQPLSAPLDVKRYFITPQESGELCLLATVFGENLDVFFPKLSSSLNLTTFADIARAYLEQRGFDAFECDSEQEARDRVDELRRKGKWPCYFFNTDTTGEKGFEEFYTSSESVDWSRYNTIGVIKNSGDLDIEALERFEEGYQQLRARGEWSKPDLLALFNQLLPEFGHLETGKYLDQRM